MKLRAKSSIRVRLRIELLASAPELLPGISLAHGDALQRAGSAVQNDSASSAPCDPRDPCDPCDNEDESFLGALVGGVLEAIFSSGYSRSARDDVAYELEPQRLGEPYPIVPAAFTAYPYENGHPGNMTDYANLPIRPRPTTKRVWLEYGTDYDDLDLVSSGLIWENASRLGFDASWRTYLEDLDPTGHADLTIGDVGAFFRLMQSTNASLRLGLAVPWVIYDGDIDAGLSFTIGSEYFPIRPWIISAEANLGQVGAATLAHLRVTLGFQLRHAELYTGIDHLSLEGHDLTAMLFGVRG